MFKFTDKNITIVPDDYDFYNSSDEFEPGFRTNDDVFVECPFCHEFIPDSEDGEGIITCPLCRQKF
jgi:hypothetical protein